MFTGDECLHSALAERGAARLLPLLFDRLTPVRPARKRDRGAPVLARARVPMAPGSDGCLCRPMNAAPAEALAEGTETRCAVAPSRYDHPRALPAPRRSQAGSLRSSNISLCRRNHGLNGGSNLAKRGVPTVTSSSDLTAILSV